MICPTNLPANALTRYPTSALTTITDCKFLQYVLHICVLYVFVTVRYTQQQKRSYTLQNTVKNTAKFIIGHFTAEHSCTASAHGEYIHPMTRKAILWESFHGLFGKVQDPLFIQQLPSEVNQPSCSQIVKHLL